MPKSITDYTLELTHFKDKKQVLDDFKKNFPQLPLESADVLLDLLRQLDETARIYLFTSHFDKCAQVILNFEDLNRMLSWIPKGEAASLFFELNRKIPATAQNQCQRINCAPGETKKKLICELAKKVLTQKHSLEDINQMLFDLAPEENLAFSKQIIEHLKARVHQIDQLEALFALPQSYKTILYQKLAVTLVAAPVPSDEEEKKPIKLLYSDDLPDKETMKQKPFPQTKDMQRFYRSKAGWFSISQFTLFSFWLTPEDTVHLMKQHAEKNPNGASSKTLQHFGLS